MMDPWKLLKNPYKFILSLFLHKKLGKFELKMLDCLQTLAHIVLLGPHTYIIRIISVEPLYEYTNFIKQNRNFIGSQKLRNRNRPKYTANISEVRIRLQYRQTRNPSRTLTSRSPGLFPPVLLYSNMASQHLRASRRVSQSFEA